MLRSLKLSRGEKVLAGALSIVALGAGLVVADERPAAVAVQHESTVADQLAGLDLEDLAPVDAVSSSADSAEPADAAANTVATESSHGSDNAGDVAESVSVTVDGKDVPADQFGDNDVSVDTTNSGTLDDSENGTDVDVDRSANQDVRNHNRVHNNQDIDTNVGDNDVSGNKNPVTVHPGNVKINFSLPH